MEGTLPVWDTITAAWEKVTGAKGTVWAAIGIMFAIMIGFNIVAGIIPVLSKLIALIGQIVNILMQAGLIYIGISRAKNAPINYAQVFRAFDTKLGLNIIFLNILTFFIMLPFIAILVGGVFLAAASPFFGFIIAAVMVCVLIYVIARLALSTGFVIDKNLGAIDAIKASFKVTNDHVWGLIGIYLLMFCFMIISMIPLGIGLIWTLPLALVVYGSVYQKLAG